MAEAVTEVPKNSVVLRDVSILDIGDNGGRGLIPVIDTFLGFKPEDRPKALVLMAEVSGASPDALNPYIKKCVDAGIPVFLLSKHYSDEKGPQVMRYETHKNPAEAGATLLRDVNATQVIKVAGTIQMEINNGKTGVELNKAITDQFGTPPFEGDK